MFYLLFCYFLADQRKLYQKFKSKEELIKFIEEKKEEIEIDKIIEPGREFKLNWILRLDEVGKPESQKRGKKKEEKKKRERIDEKKVEEEKVEPEQLEKEEPEKEEIELIKKPKETKEEIKKKHEALMKRGDAAIEAAEKEQEDKGIKWELCTKCKTTKVATSSGRTKCLKCLKLEKELSLSKKEKPEILLKSESRTNKSKEKNE